MPKVELGEGFYTLLHPRPVVLIVATDPEGKANAMACAWITPVSEEPPILAACLSEESYTRELILKTREFTVNIPTAQLLEAVRVAGTKSGRKVDKIPLMRVTLSPSKAVKPPIIAECVGHIECKTRESVVMGECTVFFADVVVAYADKELLARGLWRLDRAEVLLHVGGNRFAKAQPL